MTVPLNLTHTLDVLAGHPVIVSTLDGGDHEGTLDLVRASQHDRTVVALYLTGADPVLVPWHAVATIIRVAPTPPAPSDLRPRSLEHALAEADQRAQADPERTARLDAAFGRMLRNR